MTVWSTRSIWTSIVAVVVLCLQLCSVNVMTAAVPACKIPGHVVMEAHNLLRDLGTLFPVHCLPYNINATFPRAAIANSTQCHQALRALHHSLQAAEQVFEDYDIPLGEGGLAWDHRKLDDFQNLQHRLLHRDGCLPATAATPDLGFTAYFGNVSTLLQQQDSATCGWSMLRRDVLWALKTALRRHHSCFNW
ncbi:interferon alpha-1-like [Syngnathus typhle]